MTSKTDALSPRNAAASSVSLNSTRNLLPPDLANLTRIFFLVAGNNENPEEVRERCCHEVVRACHEGGSANLQKIEQARQMMSSLHDKAGRHPLAILRENHDEKAADLLSKILIKEAKEVFAREGDTELLRTSLIPQLFDVYLDSLETGNHELLLVCRQVLGTLVSGESEDLKEKDPYFSHLSPAIGKKLWKYGDKYKDSVLKAFCAMLYKSFDDHHEAVPSKLAKNLPERVFSIPFFPQIQINAQGLSSLHWQLLGSSDISKVTQFANIIGIEHLSLDIPSSKTILLTRSLFPTLCGIPTLRSLELSESACSNPEIKELLIGLAKSCKIHSLSLYATDQFPDIANILNKHFNLTSFTIYFGDQSSSVGFTPIIHALANSKALREFKLHLSFRPIFSVELIPILEMLKMQSNLISLYIAVWKSRDDKADPGFASCLAELCSKLKLLQTLCLISLNIDGARLFTDKLEKMKCLKKLVISQNRLNNKEINYFSEWLLNQTDLLPLPLAQFDLSHNSITFEGAKVLARTLHLMPRLESLDLTHNQIGDEGIEAIASALGNHSRAIVVKLDGNPVSAACLKRLNTGLGRVKYEFKEAAITVTPTLIVTDLHPEPNGKGSPQVPQKALPKTPPRRSSSPRETPTAQSNEPPKEMLPHATQELHASPRSKSPAIVTSEPAPSTPPHASEKHVDVIQGLRRVVEKTAKTESPELFSAEAMILKGLKDLQNEQELLNSQGTSPEQLRTRALVLRQDLKQEIAGENQKFGELSQQQVVYKHQLDEIQRKLDQKGDKAEQLRLEEEQRQLKERMAVVEAQVSILMNERYVKDQKRAAIKQFLSDPNLLLCYRTVQIKLEELFISFKAVAGGFVPTVGGDLAIYQTLLGVIGDHATIVPIIGDAAQKILNIGGMAIGHVDGKRQVNTALNASELVTLSEMKKLAESVARRLTENYAEQLQLLATSEQEEAFQSSLQKKGDQVKEKIFKEIHCPPAKKFAAFGFFWIFEELRNIHQQDLKTEELDNLLIAAICQKTPPETIKRFWQEITKKLHLEGVVDKTGKIMLPEELYTLSGIKTDKGEYYSGPRQKPEIYGWRIGTHEDVRKLGFNKVPVPADRVQAKLEFGGVKQAHLLERDRQLQHHDGRLDRLEKTAHVVEGARVNAVAAEIEALKLENERAKKALRDSFERKLKEEREKTDEKIRAALEEIVANRSKADK